MREWNRDQLKAVEQISINAGTVVLGTLILGGAVSPQSFKWIYLMLGVMIYAWLFWVALRVNTKRKN